MDGSDLGDHTLHEFDQELEDLRMRLARMAGLVASQLERALESVRALHTTLASAVAGADTAVNEPELDGRCAPALALRQPMASDLRFVISASNATTDPERIGDRACNLAEYIVHFAKGRDARHAGIDRLHGEVEDRCEAAPASCALVMERGTSRPVVTARRGAGV